MNGEVAKLFLGISASFSTVLPIVTAFPAIADASDPWVGCNVNPPTSACNTTAPGAVPGMNRSGAGEPCTDTVLFVFAASATGETLACQGKPAHYVRTTEVIGVRQNGAACREQGWAQSPYGLPLECLARNERQTWTVSFDFQVDDEVLHS
jgi:hypothetical protein